MKQVIRKELQWMIAALFVLLLCLTAAWRTEAASAQYTLYLNGNWQSGATTEKGDVHTYYFSTSTAGFVNIMYQGQSIADSYVQVMDGDQTVQFEKTNVYTSSETSPKTQEYSLALEAGSYCVKVWGYGNHVGTYRLKASFTAAGNTEAEPNDGFDKAMLLKPGSAGMVKGFISRTDNLDFYKIQVPSDQKIKVTYTSKIRDSYCEIWDADQISKKKQSVYTGTEDSPKTYTYEESLKAGTYYIKISKYSSYTGRYTLMWETEHPVVYVTGIQITGNKTMKPGSYLYLSTKVSPSNANDQTVTWSSSNTAVATIDSNGRVYARKAGKTTITALAKDGSKVKGTCTLTISENASTTSTSGKKVTSISVSGNKKVAAGKKFTLKAKVYPSSAINKAVTWTSSNKKVATVSSKGVVTTKKPGKTIIQVKAKDGSGVNKKITVIVLPKKMAAPKLSVKSGVLRIAYKKQSGVSGYQVAYSTAKSFKNYHVVNLGSGKSAVNVKGLTAGKTYYTRVRSYVKIGSKKYYGAWSSTKKAVIK